MRHVSILALLLAAFCLSENVNGQGLIFRLPEDGKGVEYEGTITYENVTDDASDEDADGIYEEFSQKTIYGYIEVSVGNENDIFPEDEFIQLFDYDPSVTSLV